MRLPMEENISPAKKLFHELVSRQTASLEKGGKI